MPKLRPDDIAVVLSNYTQLDDRIKFGGQECNKGAARHLSFVPSTVGRGIFTLLLI